MIALDAMGGDNAPYVTVHGAIDAARRRSIAVTLFGDEQSIHAIASAYDPNWKQLPLSIVHCTESIAMSEEPTRSVLTKKDASLVQAVQAVKKGMLKAVVSAGNSGASLVAGSLIFGRMKSIIRPALVSFIPTLRGSFLCLDLGGTVDCKPDFLLQFAYMGTAFVQELKNIHAPRVALLSNGVEPYKGSEVVKKAYSLLERSALNFVGNMEPRDIFDANLDVLVCDGFAGNIMLKTMQGTVRAIKNMIKHIGSRSLLNKLSLLCGMPLLHQLHAAFDYSKNGGALLLGVPHPFIVTHGASTASAIEHAIYYAYDVVTENIITRFENRLQIIQERSHSVHHQCMQQQSIEQGA